MGIEEFKGKKITVMGLGLHGGGIGIVRFLAEAGAKVTVTDIKTKEELAPSLEKLKDLKGVEYVLGQHRTENFTATDMVVKNPAAPWTNKYIQLALQHDIPVEMDSSLFFKLCKNQIIGITGTKGKTTVSSLIYSILLAAGKNPLKVGIGQVSVLDKLKELKKDTVVVFELSSWRLSALGKYKMSPSIAVMTNLYPDHLNYYKNIKEYLEDKKNIFLFQKKDDGSVINDDDQHLKTIEEEIKGRLIKFSKHKIERGRGVYLENDAVYYNDGNDEKRIILREEITLPGEHNMENVLAAAGAAILAGTSLEDIRKGIIAFKGVPHRLELVREIGGIKFVNDTAATTPEAAISGIKSFLDPVILIGGGSDKNLEMGGLAKIILEKTKDFVFLKGAGTDKLIFCLKKIRPEMASYEFKVAESMEEAIEAARRHAKPGDVILLSPGAASFGLFQNEFDRGDRFRNYVRKIEK